MLDEISYKFQGLSSTESIFKDFQGACEPCVFILTTNLGLCEQPGNKHFFVPKKNNKKTGF